VRRSSRVYTIAFPGAGRIAWLLLPACLILLLACAPNYLDPGANPAQVRVRVEAQSSTEVSTSRRFDANPTWFWGLYGPGPSEAGSPYPPKGGGRLPTQTAKVLKQEATFLLPPGKQQVVLRLEADLEVPDSEGSRVVTVATFEEVIALDLQPGQTKVIKRRFGY